MMRLALIAFAFCALSLPAMAQDLPPQPVAMENVVAEPQAPAPEVAAEPAPAPAEEAAEVTEATEESSAEPAAEETAAATEEPQEQQEPGSPKAITPAEMVSVLFTYWERKAIEDAKRSRGLVRPPSEDELMKDIEGNSNEELGVKPPPEERDISLGGIVFVSDNDWTIWLNGERVTPKAIPEEVIDLRVHNEYIELKWYDNWSDQIFPIRLRPHQRFNIDTRIFLPG